jgi:short-subunit dehydrogenase involved in D-alanine esterification of teichoic acids
MDITGATVMVTGGDTGIAAAMAMAIALAMATATEVVMATATEVVMAMVTEVATAPPEVPTEGATEA